jgi:DNA replication initiation complex subunit (GINS family)
MTVIYNQLFDLVRKEKAHQELQELPLSFYADAKTFFDEVQAKIRVDPFASDNEHLRIQIVNGNS